MAQYENRTCACGVTNYIRARYWRDRAYQCQPCSAKISAERLNAAPGSLKTLSAAKSGAQSLALGREYITRHRPPTI